MSVRANLATPAARASLRFLASTGMVRFVPMSNDNSSCKVCGDRLWPGLLGVRDPLSGDCFDVLRCNSCGLGQTSPVPTNLEEHYREAYYGGRHTFTAAYCASRRVRMVERATSGIPSSLLDIGCGDGSFLLTAARRGYRIVGTEIGAAARQARASGIDVRSSLDDVKDVAPFAVITMWHTLEHFTSPRAVLADVSSLLDDRGVLIVAVPNAQGLQARIFGRHWFHLDVPRHVYHFGHQSLSILLERAGFEVERWYHQELEYDMFGWLQSGLNAVTATPNALFQAMTGRPKAKTNPSLPLHYALGSVLAPAAAMATLAGTALHSGGTLVAVARRGSSP
jgi:SAM-dependent methyltransferase